MAAAQRRNSHVHGRLVLNNRAGQEQLLQAVLLVARASGGAVKAASLGRFIFGHSWRAGDQLMLCTNDPR